MNGHVHSSISYYIILKTMLKFAIFIGSNHFWFYAQWLRFPLIYYSIYKFNMFRIQIWTIKTCNNQTFTLLQNQKESESSIQVAFEEKFSLQKATYFHRAFYSILFVLLNWICLFINLLLFFAVCSLFFECALQILTN